MRRLLPGRRPLFPEPRDMKIGPDGLVAIGGDLSPETVVEAYRKGVFPWDGHKPYPWFSPDPRLVLYPERFHASRSLRKLARSGKLTVVYDQHFAEVMAACAVQPRPGQDGTWISRRMIRVYTKLHERGVGHCVAVLDADGRLVGGLYGLAMGRIFFGESMFARRRDASKLAFYDLCVRLEAADYHLADCQAETEHLKRLGAETIPRLEYLDELAEALDLPDGWEAAMAHDTARLGHDPSPDAQPTGP